MKSLLQSSSGRTAAGCQIRNLPALRITQRLCCARISMEIHWLYFCTSAFKLFQSCLSCFIDFISDSNPTFYADYSTHPVVLIGSYVDPCCGNKVVNWNVQAKSYLVSFGIMWGNQSATSQPLQCLQFVQLPVPFACLPVDLLLTGGGWVDVLWLYKMSCSVRCWQALLDLWALALCLNYFNCLFQHMASYQPPQVWSWYEQHEVQLSNITTRDVLRHTNTHKHKNVNLHLEGMTLHGSHTYLMFEFKTIIFSL